jgi:hypothetical protein
MPTAAALAQDPGRGVARVYSLMIERDLFGRIVLVHN